MTDEGFPARLWELADLFTPMAVRVAATLRLADHVAGGADSLAALVERTGTDPGVLGRLVDHLVTIGLLERSDTDTLTLTDLGEQLREGHPGDGRAWLDIEGSVGRADLSALRLLDTVEILRRCAQAAGTTGRLLVIEHALLEGGAESGMRTGMDLRMLAFSGGRERTLDEFERLAAEVGLRVSEVHRVSPYRSVLELRG